MGDIGDKTPANSYKSLIRVDDGAAEGHEEFHASSTVKRLTTAGGATGSAVFVSGEHLIVSRQDVTSLAGTGTPSSGTFDTHFQNSNELTVRANTGASILAVEAGSDSYTSGAGTGNLGARIRLVTRAYQEGEANNDNKGFGQQMWEIMNYGDNWSGDSVSNAARFIIKDTTANQDRFVIKAVLGNDGFRTGTAYTISETGMHGVGLNQNDYQFRVAGQGDAKIDRMLFVNEITYYVAAGSYDYGSGACVPSDENDGYDYKKPLKTMDEALSRIASTRGGNTRVNIHLIMQTIDSDGSLSTRTAQGNWNTIGGKMADNNSRVPDGDGVEGDNYISAPYFTFFDKRLRFRGYTYNAQLNNFMQH